MESPIVYFCDPSKNHECKKTACQDLCFLTTEKEYSIDGIPMKYNPENGEVEIINVDQK